MLRLAFAATMVDYSNYSYEPSLGRKAAVGRPEVDDFPVAAALAAKAMDMADDAAWYRRARAKRRRKDARVVEASFLDGYRELPAGGVDLLVTSPPYLNNYHYNRNTRPPPVLAGLLQGAGRPQAPRGDELRHLLAERRERERVDLDPVAAVRELEDVLEDVRQRNAHKGIYGGQGWANYAALYFNDCARFSRAAAWCLRPGATRAGGRRQQHPPRRTRRHRPLPGRHRRALRLAGRGHPHAPRHPRGKQHRELERARRHRRRQAPLRIHRRTAKATIALQRGRRTRRESPSRGARVFSVSGTP